MAAAAADDGSLDALQAEDLNLEDMARAMPVGLAVYDRHGTQDPYIVGKFHKYLNKVLLKVASGEEDRVHISVPPQTGKSTLAQYFLAWFLGNWPRKNAIYSSYADTLAHVTGLRVRRLLKEHGTSLWDEARDIQSAQATKGDWRLEAGGGLLSAGIRAGITGREAQLVVLDDLIKNMTQARSETVRDAVWREVKTVANTRLSGEPSAIVHIGTRWHCLLPGSQVLTPTGLRPIEDLAEEDKVCTSEGVGEVLGHASREHEGTVYQIHRHGQPEPLRLTPEHRVFTKRGWVPARDLEVSDWILAPATGEPMGKEDLLDLFPPPPSPRSDRSETRMTGENATIPRDELKEHLEEGRTYDEIAQRYGLSNRSSVYNYVRLYDLHQPSGNTMEAEVVLDPMFWRMVGYWLAEGDRTRGGEGRARNVVRWTFGAHEPEYIREVEAFWESQGLDSGVTAVGHESAKQVKGSCAQLSQFLSEFGDGAHHRSLPGWALHLPPSFARELVKGWVWGDGYIRDDGARSGWVRVSSVSLSLMLGMQRLLAGLGVAANVMWSGHHYELRFPAEEAPWLVEEDYRPIDRRHVEVGDKGLWLKVKEVNEEQYEGPVWDIKTPTRDFIAEGARVHNSDDPGGRIKEELEDGVEDWLYINLPALALEDDLMGREPGEPVAPFRHSKEELERRKVSMGSYRWNALFQGQPSPPEGSRFKREWFQYFTIVRDEHGNEWFKLLPNDREPFRVSVTNTYLMQTVDLAAKESEQSNYCVIATWAVTPDSQLLLLDVWRKKAETTKHQRAIRRAWNKWRKWNLKFVGIEKKQAGLNLVQTLRDGPIVVKPLDADRDKVARSLTMSAKYENGEVYHLRGAGWLGDWEDELAAFPTGKWDDQVDCCPAGTLIRTRDGVLPIEEVEEGMEVLTHRGRFREVTDTMSRTAPGLYRVDAAGRPPVRVTESHDVLSMKSKSVGRRGALGWEEGTEWLCVGDGLGETHGTTSVYPRGVEDTETIELGPFAPDSYTEEGGELRSFFSDGHENPKAKPLPSHLQVDEDFCFLIGYYAAEGSCGDHSVRFSSHEDEEAPRERVRRWADDLGLETSTFEEGKSVTININNMVLRNFFQEWGSGRGKRLPEWVQRLPDEKLRWVLVGYLVGDGHFPKQGAVCNGVSPTLLQQVYEMSLRLGLRATLYRRRFEGRNDQWVVNWARPDTEKLMKWVPSELLEGKTVSWEGPTDVDHDQTWVRFNEGYLVGRIHDIQPEPGPVKVYNLSVEEDESYVANGTVVHNCASYAGILADADVRSEAGAFGPSTGEGGGRSGARSGRGRSGERGRDHPFEDRLF